MLQDGKIDRASRFVIDDALREEPFSKTLRRSPPEDDGLVGPELDRRLQALEDRDMNPEAEQAAQLGKGRPHH